MESVFPNKFRSKTEKKTVSDRMLGPHTSPCQTRFFPQIAIAIGVLTSNRGEGDEPLWRIGRGTRVPLQGAVDVVPLQGDVVHYGWGGRVTTNFVGGVTWCHCCHCSVLFLDTIAV